MKIFFTTIAAAFAFAASANARICQDGTTLKEAPSCSSSCLCREFIPADVTIVDVAVVKRTGSTTQTISEFSLSNAGGSDTATGSLDNIDLGTYYVTVLSRRINSGDFIAPSTDISPLCVPDSSKGDVLFFGQTSDFDISQTDGSAKNVKVFMQPCHPIINYEANDLGAIPNYPPLTVEVNIDADAAVLNSGGTARIVIQTTNPNMGSPYTGTGIAVKENKIGVHGGTTMDAWTVPSAAGTVTFTSTFQDVPLTVDSDRRTSTTISYAVNDAKQSYTTTASIRPYSYDPTGTLTERATGSISTVSLVVAPVGDLDLEVLFFTGVRPKQASVTVGTIGSSTITPEYERLSYDGFNGVSECGQYDPTEHSKYLVPGQKECVNRENVVNFDRTSCNYSPQTTGFKLEYNAMALYGIDRKYKIEVTPMKAIGGANQSICDTVGVTFDRVEDFDTALNSGSYSLNTEMDLAKVTSAGLNNQELTAVLNMKLTSGAEFTEVNSCEFTITTTTYMVDPSNLTDRSVRKTANQKFQFITVPYGKLCDLSVAYGSSMTTQAAACPVMKQIEWGSTDGFKNSKACSTSSQAQDHTIELCIMTKVQRDANGNVPEDPYTSDDSVTLEISDESGANVFTLNSVTAPVEKVDGGSDLGACSNLVSDTLVKDDDTARAKLVKFQFPSANEIPPTISDSRLRGPFDVRHRHGGAHFFWALPEGVTAARVQVRYWAVDSWDGGEYGILTINDLATPINRRTRASYNSCGGNWHSNGHYQNPNPHNHWGGPKCWLDVNQVVPVTNGGVKIVAYSNINQYYGDESYYISNVVITPTSYDTGMRNHPICTNTDMTKKYYARIKAASYSFSTGDSNDAEMCDDQMGFSSYTSTASDTAHAQVICPDRKNNELGTCTESRKRRSLAASGCPDASQSPFACPATNTMPFDIKVENGRLSVTMDTSFVGDKTLSIAANPVGLVPRRKKFIASDFDNIPSTWDTSLRTKLNLVVNDRTLSENMKPGAKVVDLVTCCAFTVDEATKIVEEMDKIASEEMTQMYKPVITIQSNNQQSSNQGSSSSNMQAGTASESTTSTSTTTSDSSGSLLVVVAVAAVLVLVGVIALAIYTVKNKQQSQRVIDLRGDQKGSWSGSSDF